MRITEREFKKWHAWLAGNHEKCPVCGRPMPGYREESPNGDACGGSRNGQRSARRVMARWGRHGV